MAECHRENGVRFLAGLLDASEELQFVDHLDSCDGCRQWLEEDSGNEQEWEAVRTLLSRSGESASSLGLMAAEVIESSAEVANPPSLSFLAPTDDPAMIGRLGPYEVSGFLGRGSMGIVVKGFDRALNRNVAIKVLDPAIAGTGAARQRFAREARAMAAMSHEHVVSVYGVDEHAGLPYFVMEYVAGGALERRLKAEGVFDVVAIVRIGLQVAQALAAAHSQGLVHRDIKPGNILLDHGTERVRVADFGLARIANDVSCTHSGLIAGTPQYMAPEQVRGERCDAQSDLFSLGGVMYALCTGHAPFRAESVYAVLQRIVHDQPRPIREQNPLIPAWLEEFVLRLLEKEKSARFTSADQVATILQDELARLNNPASSQEGPRSWSRNGPLRAVSVIRRRAAIALAVVCVVGMVTVFVRGLPVRQETGVQSDRTGGGNAPEPGPEFASQVPLWEVDGLDKARHTAHTLESDWQTLSADIRDGAWIEQVSDIRRRLAILSAEFESISVPPPAKSAGSSQGR